MPTQEDFKNLIDNDETFRTRFNALDMGSKRKFISEYLKAGSTTQEEEPADTNTLDIKDEVQEAKSVRDIYGAKESDNPIVGAAKNVAADAVIAPAVEVARGFLKGNERLSKEVSSLSSLSANPLNPIPPVFNKFTSDIFEDAAKATVKISGSLPETNMNSTAKFIYNLAGEAPSMAAEFLAAKNVLGPASRLIPNYARKSLGEVGQMALVQAISNFSEDKELSSLAKGAVDGAFFGMAGQAGAKLASTAASLTNRFGSKVGEAWVAFTTGKKELAKDFTKNPSKYLSPDVKKTVTEATKEFTEKQNALKLSHKNNMFFIKEENKAKISDLSEKYRSLKDASKTKYDDTLKALKENNVEKVDAFSKELTKNMNQREQIVHENLLHSYDNLINKTKTIIDQSGKNVELAVNTIRAQNPMAGVSPKIVDKYFDDAIKTSPFKVTPEGLQSRIAGREAADIKQFNAIVEQYNNVKGNGVISFEYLQDLKNATRELADTAYNSGKKDLGKMYANLSKSVNPVNIAESVKPSQMTPELKFLKESNADYSAKIKKYNEALEFFTTKDANGKIVPNMNAGQSTVKGGKVDSLRRMEMADKLLDPEDRIVPKLKDSMNKLNDINQDKKVILKSYKKNLVKREKLIAEKRNAELKRIDSESRKLTAQERATQRKIIHERSISDSNELSILKSQIDDELAILEGRDTLNSLLAHGSLSRRIQNIAQIGIYTNWTANKLGRDFGITGPSIALTAATSPLIASRATKLASDISNKISKSSDAIIGALEKTGTKKMAGRIGTRKIIENKDEIESALND